MSTPKVKQIKVEPLQQGPTRSRQTNGINNNGLNDNNVSNNSNSNGSKSYGAREKGVIEKMLASYGFVQCSERRGRFFFHYSEYKGNLNSLKVGDAVEFQESTDKRTHKPVAILIVKLNDFSNDVVGGKQFEGVVLTDAKTRGSSSGDYSSPEMGRVTYEQGGETFFLPFAGEDVENGQRVNVGDKVMFVVANDLGTGSMRARRLRKRSSPCDLHQGVVCSMKDNFGFIERADVVKEIFFHFSEFEGDIEDLALGDDVEYGIQVRNNKDVAVSIHKIAPGSVVFEDVAREVMRGRIKKTLKMTSNKKVNDALIGRIVSETVTGPIEIVFGEKDPVGDFTMFVGDIVEFSIATDRRDKVQHATNIRLVDDTFSISKEKREKGFITTLKEGFGFIRCTDREARMFFHFSELLNVDHKLTLQDEVDFTVIQDPTNATRQVAVRIKVLPRGTIVVQSSSSSLDKFVGTIQKEAGNLRSIQGSKDPDPGILMYEVEGTKQMIPYSSSVVDGNLPKLDEKVEFQISECQKNKTKVAKNVRVIGRTNGREKERGFVVTIKEGFGFIETSDHEKEIYFHFSNFEGDVDSLEVGYEVEFQICNKAGRVSAECIRRIPNKSIQIGEVHATMLEGRVARGLHSQDSSEYFGLIQLTSSSDPEAEVPPTPTSAPPTNPIGSFPFPSESANVFPFSIMSLVDKRETLLVRGDLVRFQLVEVQGGVVSNGSTNGKEFVRSDSTSGGVTKKKWAYRVAPFRKFIHAKIETLNETGGTLSYESDLGSRLTFNVKDVQDPSELSVGDEVEFVVLQMNGGGKMAVNVQKATDRPRPERLLSRIKSVTDEQCPRAMATRQPKGPDGTKGFRCIRKEVDRNRPDKNLKSVVESSKEMVMAGGDAGVCGDAGVAKFEEGEVFEGVRAGVHADGSPA